MSRAALLALVCGLSAGRAQAQDAGVADAGAADAGVAEANVADGGAPEAGAQADPGGDGDGGGTGDGADGGDGGGDGTGNGTGDGADGGDGTGNGTGDGGGTGTGNGTGDGGGNGTGDGGGNGTGEDPSASIRYLLERVVLRGSATREEAVLQLVRFHHGDVLDVDDPQLEAVRWRLLGTGWFRDVRVRLERAERRGWVLLVIDVEPRNTLVVQQVVVGVSEGLINPFAPRGSLDLSRASPYAGVALAESNLFGLGMSLAAAAVVSEQQQAFRLRWQDPLFLGSPFALGVSVFLNNARESFGSGSTRVSACAPATPACTEAAFSADVLYRRTGFGLGTANEIGGGVRYALDWQGEVVDLNFRPAAAAAPRGTGPGSVRPIDFQIRDGTSFVSVVQLGVTWDARDDPGMPTRGALVQTRLDLSTSLIGSTYDFLRAQVSASVWLQLPWQHVLRFGGFAGAVFGNAPFFYRFYASDLSDLIPSRALELNLDRRPPPNLLGTAIAELVRGDLAARVDVEYAWPVVRGGDWFHGVDLYALAGLYMLMSIQDVRLAIPGYDGFARFPMDFTFDVGVRADTELGLLQFGFSNVLGFL